MDFIGFSVLIFIERFGYDLLYEMYELHFFWAECYLKYERPKWERKKRIQKNIKYLYVLLMQFTLFPVAKLL